MVRRDFDSCDFRLTLIDVLVFGGDLLAKSLRINGAGGLFVFYQLFFGWFDDLTPLPGTSILAVQSIAFNTQVLKSSLSHDL